MVNSKQPPKLLTYLIPSISNIFWIVPFHAVLTMGIRMMNGDGDLGRHLTVGKYILENQHIPRLDIFSHTKFGLPITSLAWLSQVLFALAKRIMGYEGVILLSALVIATSFWLIFNYIRRDSKTLMASVVTCTLVISTSMVHWVTRPHIFTFLFLALWMMALEHLRQGKIKRWWMMPVLMLFWANLHPAFFAGFVIWFIYGIGVAWDSFIQKNPEIEDLPEYFWYTYLLGGVTAFLATLLNPSGIDLWKTSIGYVGIKYLVDITVEYQSPNFHLISFWPFLNYIGLMIIFLD